MSKNGLGNALRPIQRAEILAESVASGIQPYSVAHYTGVGVARFEFVEWLFRWLFLQLSFEFEWDQGNQIKNVEKHGVENESAEEVFQNRADLELLGKQIEPVVSEERFAVLGKDSKGQKFFVNFTIRENRIRPISVRRMSEAERKTYERLRKSK